MCVFIRSFQTFFFGFWINPPVIGTGIVSAEKLKFFWFLGGQRRLHCTAMVLTCFLVYKRNESGNPSFVMGFGNSLDFGPK